MTDDLQQLLRNLKLHGIEEILDAELAAATKDGPSYADFLARLLRHQYYVAHERALECRIARARIPERWALETFPWDKQPSINRAQIEQLAELDFVATGTNLVFVGETGVGKTALATGIVLRALRQGYRGRFVDAQELFDDMYRSLADHSSRRLINHLVGIDVLLIDEMSYLNLRPESSNMFFKLMEERYIRRKPTLLTTNLEY
jgi:DNA replication protein DnaC